MKNQTLSSTTILNTVWAKNLKAKMKNKISMKISIRFFNDREMGALWDDDQSKWWFSVLDIVGVLNDESDYTKIRNYWKYLKAKLKKENSEVVSVTTQFKLLAPDGKKRLADMLDSEGVDATSRNRTIYKINDREMFMKGIDYSYYYEE